MLRTAVLILALLLPSVAAAQQPTATLATVPSKHTVEETLARLTKEIEAKGLTIISRVDHANGAKGVGMELPPTVVLFFGSPKLGTPLMQENPQIGIDLPTKMLVWRDKAGKVWIGYTPPATLQARHKIRKRENVAILHAMAIGLDAIAKAAGN